MTPDVNVVVLDFPRPGKEMVFENEDGSFTIMINAKLSNDSQLKAYHHAMKHISNDDFQKDNIQTIEAIAHSTTTIPESAERIPSKQFLKRLKALRAERKRLQLKLNQMESEMEVIRSMEGDSWDIPSRQQWFGY